MSHTFVPPLFLTHSQTEVKTSVFFALLQGLHPVGFSHLSADMGSFSGVSRFPELTHSQVQSGQGKNEGFSTYHL